LITKIVNRDAVKIQLQVPPSLSISQVFVMSVYQVVAINTYRHVNLKDVTVKCQFTVKSK